jgi:hypothetical protein
MTANYTPDEIQAAVEQIVLSTVARPLDTLGVLRTDVTFTDVQQAAAGVFVLYGNAPFYVVFLGSNRLLTTDIPAESQTISSLLDAVNSLGRKVLPVEDVSPLYNAKAALQELGTAAGSRTAGFTDVTGTAAYQRFATNAASFLNGPAGQAVKQNGAIVLTPQQARAAIPGLMSQLTAQHAALVAKVQLLAGALDDYAGLNLPQLLATNVLNNAAALVGADADVLNSLSREDRLGYVRTAILNLLAAKSAVTTFGTFNPPTDFFALTGTGFGYSDANHKATPAQLVNGLMVGAFAIVAGVNDTLALAMDGRAPIAIQLATSPIAEFDGNQAEPFVIGDGSSPVPESGFPQANNNKFKLKVGNTTYVATLTSSGGATEAVAAGGDLSGLTYGPGGSLDGLTLNMKFGSLPFAVTFNAPADINAVVAQLNAPLQPLGVQAGLFFTSIFLQDVQHVGAKASQFTIVGGPAMAVLGFTAGTYTGGTPTRSADQVASDINAALVGLDVVAESFFNPLVFSGQVNIPAGLNPVVSLAFGGTDFVALGVQPGYSLQVTSGANTGYWPITAVTSTTLTIAGTTVLQGSAPCEVGPPNKFVRVRCTNPAVQVPAELALEVIGDDTPSKGSAQLLGMPVGVPSNCLLTTADTLVKDIKNKTSQTSSTTAVVPQVSPSTVFGAQVSGLPVRSNLSDALTVTVSEVQGAGAAVFALGTLTLTVTSIAYGGTASVGYAMVVRSGANLLQSYMLQTINGGTTAKALAVGDVLVFTGAGTNDGAMAFELGDTVSGFTKYATFNVSAGPNKGTYCIDSQTSPLDFVLQTPLPTVRAGADPVFMTGDFGWMDVVLTSLDTTTASRVTPSGNASDYIFGAPADAKATTPWFQLPSIPRGLQPGDLLQFYPTNYAVVGSEFLITSVDTTLKLIGVSPDVPVASGSWTFTPQPPPVARLRVGTMNDYSVYKTQLTAWLANTTQSPLFLQSLNRLINPLLANQNPTVAQLSTAANALIALFKQLTIAAATTYNGVGPLEGAVKGYTAEPVPAIDALIKSYIEKGSDRAVDLLLGGQFSAFFGLTVNNASYAGAFQDATRAVARNDLPVRKYSRPETQTGRLLGQSQSEDFEFTSSDITEGAQVDPPTGASNTA